MRIILSGGGTAGHINPALALAEELTKRGHEVLFAGTPEGLESRLVPEAGYEYKGFDAEGFDRAKVSSLIKSTRKIMRSTAEVTKWLMQVRPYGVVAFGGYVCLPVARAARTSNVPVVIHEQNSVMGMANKYLSNQVQAVALTYPEAGEGIKYPELVTITGNPVRSDFFKATREEGRAMLGIPDDAIMVLVFGGSLGARHLNEAVVALKDEILELPNVYIVHITGPKEYDSVVASLNLTEEEAKRWIVMGYQDKMAETMAAADAVVSRAGATSLAEISARRIPALLVPYPHATADHQTRNAEAYVERGAAYIVDDENLDTDEFKLRFFSLIVEPEVRAAMREAAATFETENAAVKLADLVIETIKEHHLEITDEELYPDRFEESVDDEADESAEQADENAEQINENAEEPLGDAANKQEETRA